MTVACTRKLLAHIQQEMDNNDYVVLDRAFFGDCVVESVMTFSDISFQRERDIHAFYATPNESSEDCRSDDSF
jgi:hypothetical protein